MTKYKLHFLLSIIIFIMIIISSCNKSSKFSSTKNLSHSTGWAYNNPEIGSLEISKVTEQKTGPGLVFIEGGTFVMGATQEDVLKEWNNVPRKVTVPSFYIDETEVSNLDYLEYLHWLKHVFGKDHPEVYIKALPDTLVWREQLSYNEPLVEMYLRHPSFHNYPVVGVSWVQANEYCKWRTDRVNERLLIEAGILSFDLNQKNENNFNTEAYLAGQYEGKLFINQKKGTNSSFRSLNENSQNNLLNITATIDTTSSNLQYSIAKRVGYESGKLLPNYRLPTEAEWEYAALGLIGNFEDDKIIERNTYPWKGNQVRSKDKKYMGAFLANFKRGNGDYTGIAGSYNDGADITAPVGSYWPNDFGLYNMGGNVSEWVQDVYRPLSYEDVEDYSPFRGNYFMKKKQDYDGMLVEKDSLGRIIYEPTTAEDNKSRRNYRKADNINYKDGDLSSSISNDWLTDENKKTENMYLYGVNSLISDQSRVYKGGSWKDPVYYLSPGVRRFLDQNEATNYIGFRCAMSRMGSNFQK